jgi:hypothetical protein
MREYQVRICERLRVKFPGPTRQSRRFTRTTANSGLPRRTDILRIGGYVSKVPTAEVVRFYLMTLSTRRCLETSGQALRSRLLDTPTADQRLHAHAQLAARFEPRETRPHFLAHSEPVRGDKPQIGLGH